MKIWPAILIMLKWAYDRESHIGKLNRGLDEGPERGWVIISMKDDWRQVIGEYRTIATRMSNSN